MAGSPLLSPQAETEFDLPLLDTGETRLRIVADAIRADESLYITFLVDRYSYPDFVVLTVGGLLRDGSIETSEIVVRKESEYGRRICMAVDSWLEKGGNHVRN